MLYGLAISQSECKKTVPYQLAYNNYVLFNKITAPLGENSCKRNHFFHGKHSMGNFDTTKICKDFRDWEKSDMHKKITIRSLSDK